MSGNENLEINYSDQTGNTMWSKPGMYDETTPADIVPATVCMRHYRFVPCRRCEEPTPEAWSTRQADIDLVRGVQQGAIPGPFGDVAGAPMADDIVTRLREHSSPMCGACDTWGCGFGEPCDCRCHMNFCQEAADEIERLRASIDTVLAAIDEEGIAPHYHRTLIELHRRQWPTLWQAIDALREARRG